MEKVQEKAPEVISVIISVYNVSPWLRRCLESVCNQTYPHLEIICVDDGSTDDSLSILREYEARDSRIKVIHKENGGLSSARNAGLNVATGTWVSFPDPDDWLDLRTYETAIAHTDGVDAVQYRFVVVPGDSPANYAKLRKFFEYKAQGRHSFASVVCRTDVPLYVSERLLRRSIIEDNHLRFHEDVMLMEDKSFAYEYALYAGDTFLLREDFYFYYQRGSSIMYTVECFDNRLDATLKMLSYLLERMRKLGMPLKSLALFGHCIYERYKLCEWQARHDGRLDELHRAFRSFIREHALWRYADCLSVVEEVKLMPWWAKPFFSHRGVTVKWRFFYIPVLKRTCRGDDYIYRLFGIKIRKVKR